MEKEMNQEPEAQTNEAVVVDAPEAPTTTHIGAKVCAFFESLKNTLTVGEVVIFVAAYVAVGLIDLLSKNMQSQMAASGVFALGIAISFGLAFWMSKDGVRPISSFLYSTSAIGALMLAVSLIPSLFAGMKDVALVSLVSVIILGIGVLYLWISQKLQYARASFILGAIASFGFAIFIAAQLSNIPCANAFGSGAENAATLCQATPYIQNLLILVPLFALGYFGMMPKKERA